ncbi:6265_t:CDS:2, partial [Racocetra fulgida]
KLADKDLEEIFNNPLAERFLPQPDFDGIIKAVNNEPDKNISNLYIKADKWITLEKPYISSLIFKIIHQEDKLKTGISKITESNQITEISQDVEISQDAEISQIKKDLEDLTSIKKELEDLTIFKKGLEDLTSIKKELEDLTSLFDNFKNEVITKLN